MIPLYSARSERAFCEELESNRFCNRFFDLDQMERNFNALVSTKIRHRLLAPDACRALFYEVVWVADA